MALTSPASTLLPKSGYQSGSSVASVSFFCKDSVKIGALTVAISDILFIHIHISISIGADLKVWGPDEFGGIAHVDFWFFGFDIKFGASANTALDHGISLADFYEVVRTAGPPNDPPTTDKITVNDPYIAQHKYSIEAGLYPLPPTSKGEDFPSTGVATPWLVQAGALQFRIDCDFAVSAAVVITDENDKTKNLEIKPEKPLEPISSFPMRRNGDKIDSAVEIRIYSMEGGKDELMSGFKAELVMKDGAGALWRKYDVTLDPIFTSNPSGLKNGDKPTVSLCQGIRILPPDAVLDQCPIVDFDATAAMKRVIGPHDLAPAEKRQDSHLASLFEPSEVATKQWPDFGDYWTGNKEGQIDGLNKSEIRGDGVAGGGLMGLCAGALGWDRRPPGKEDPQPVDGRMEWQLKSDPPEILASELGSYYAALPLWTTTRP
ncbi:hypothetical protein GP486_002979 [Trichoglossum hirsutum]|uniref:DUF6603 domain-containing protein n=1 Tax=Trichoglossum hirsutum TaxID=265104 RepID=A0A9P8LDE3_9PEZI|nr:hypothetical protein GP486_002979 [Trichoglossum hirsutum]